MRSKIVPETHYDDVFPELLERLRLDGEHKLSFEASELAELREADLLTWSRHFLPEHFHLPPSKMHVWLAEQLDKVRHASLVQAQGLQPLGLGGTKLNIVGPRGSAKSTVTTLAFVLREALAGREKYIWIVSDTKRQAAAHLDNVKTELLENRRLREAYPEVTGFGPVWRCGAIVLPSGVMIEAIGTGQRVRGRRRRQYRPTLIVCDDLQNDGHIQSALARERSRNWFHGMLMKAGTKRTSIINLGTALHRECLTIELHRTPGWLSRTFKAIERWPDHMPLWAAWEELYCDVERFSVASSTQAQGLQPLGLAGAQGVNSASGRTIARDFYLRNKSLMDAGAELLWPEEEDLYTLMCMRAESGSTAFEREKQSTPVNPELCEWPEAYFGDWIWFDEWPSTKAEGGIRKVESQAGVGSRISAFPSPPSALASSAASQNQLIVKVISLDPSKGADARRGDYSAFVMLGVAYDGTLYLEADMMRRPTPQIVSDGIELCRRFRPQVFGIEANQFQELLGADFAAEFIHQGMIGISPCSISNTISKAVRIRRLGPLLCARRLRFKANSPGTRMLVEQLKEFPVADHDDGPDAAEMALRLAESLLRPTPDDGLGNRLI